jgi:hypothetical protein
MNNQVSDSDPGEPLVIVSQLIYRVRCDNFWITTGLRLLNLKKNDMLNIEFQSYISHLKYKTCFVYNYILTSKIQRI